MAAQARRAQIFLLPSRGRSDGHRREPWFKRPGSESQSAAVLSLASDSASRRPPIAPLQIFAIRDLLHSWGEILVLSATPPTPWLGLCHLSMTLRPLRLPLHRLSLQRSWKPLPLP